MPRRASEIARELAEKAQEPVERPGRPELRVRADAPAMTVDSGTVVETVVDQLGPESNGVVLRGQDGEAKAVVLSPERYADLAGVMIKAERVFVASETGFQPQREDLEELMVEQVDPAAGWRPGARS